MTSPILAPKVAFTLQVKVAIDPKDRDTFVKHFKIAYDIVIAEPECAYFFVGESIQEPGVFHWTEGWTKDVQWFMTEQINKPYYEPYLKATEPLYTSPRVVAAYSPLESMNNLKADLFGLSPKA